MSAEKEDEWTLILWTPDGVKKYPLGDCASVSLRDERVPSPSNCRRQGR